MITGYPIDGAMGSSGGGWVRKLSMICLHNKAIVARGILVTILHCGTPEPRLSAIYVGTSLWTQMTTECSQRSLTSGIGSPLVYNEPSSYTLFTLSLTRPSPKLPSPVWQIMHCWRNIPFTFSLTKFYLKLHGEHMNKKASSARVCVYT